MKIVILTREYPPETTWGGCAIVNYNLARALAAKGHEVHVICQGVNGQYDRLEEGVWVHRVGNDSRSYSIMARAKYMLASWRKLQELYKLGHIDIIQADDWSAEGIIGLFPKRSGLVIKTQNMGSISILRIKNFVGFKSYLGFRGLQWMARITSKHADRFISESKIDYREVTEGLGIDPKKVDLIYNGIDTNHYRYIPNSKIELGIKEDIPLVLVVGRLEAKKGIDILIKAIPIVLAEKPNTKFIFVGRDSMTAPGGGSFKEWMKLQAKKLGFLDKLIFKGFVPPEELPKFYSACDVFVLSSREESFALVVAEAMACGRPVVATPVGFIPELAQNNLKGLEVVPIENAEELAKGIIRILKLTKEEKDDIVKENRMVIENLFSLETWTNQVITTYKKVVEKKVL